MAAGRSNSRGAYVVIVIADALTNKVVNSFYPIVGYAFLWPFYWVYYLINTIAGD